MKKETKDKIKLIIFITLGVALLVYLIMLNYYYTNDVNAPKRARQELYKIKEEINSLKKRKADIISKKELNTQNISALNKELSEIEANIVYANIRLEKLK